VSPAVLPRLAGVLAAEEREHAARLIFAPYRRRFTVARAALRVILGRYLQRDPARVGLARTPAGQPILTGADASPALCFSVSHSAELTLYALARGRAVGVDVERIQPAATADLLDARMLWAGEAAAFDTLEPAARDRAVFAAWTRREAYAKARGIGLPLLETGDDVPDGWTVLELDVGPGWKAAFAIEGAVTGVRYWTWEAGGAVSGR
jgi:4'-phosphopantetheinyl transferase